MPLKEFVSCIDILVLTRVFNNTQSRIDNIFIKNISTDNVNSYTYFNIGYYL